MKKFYYTFIMLCITVWLFSVDSSFGQVIIAFDLMDAETNNPIRLLNDVDTIFLDETADSLNIVAHTEPNPLEATHKVKFILNDADLRTEGVAPYAAWGDTEGVFWKHAFDDMIGENTLRATPVLASDGSEDGSDLTIVFHVMETRPEVSSIQDLDGIALEVFPNPAEEYLHINLTNFSEITSIRLIDVQGRIQFEKSKIESAQLEIQVVDFPRECIIIEVNSVNASHTQKVLIR